MKLKGKGGGGRVHVCCVCVRHGVLCLTRKDYRTGTMYDKGMDIALSRKFIVNFIRDEVLQKRLGVPIQFLRKRIYE